MPHEWWRWHLAERFGWSLEYIDSLKMVDFHQYLQVKDGEVKAKSSPLYKAK